MREVKRIYRVRIEGKKPRRNMNRWGIPPIPHMKKDIVQKPCGWRKSKTGHEYYEARLNRCSLECKGCKKEE